MKNSEVAEGSLEHALRVLRRRKILIVVVVIVVPLIAYLISSSKEKQYTATATLLVENAEINTLEPGREVATNQILAGLPVVAKKTAEKLEGVSAEEVLGSVSAGSANSLANIATISAVTPSPELSAEIANAYSHAYIEFRKESEQSQTQQAIELVEESLSKLPLGEEGGSQEATLNDRLNRLKVKQALQTGNMQLVQPAEPPTSASSPRTKRNLELGIVLGIVLGFALAALLERLDQRIRDTEELIHTLGVPLIGRLPRSRVFSRFSTSGVVQSAEAEELRTLRANLRYFNVDRDRRTLLFASADPGEGKSTTARGLATVMAEAGDDVVLIEADLRKEPNRGAERNPLPGLSNVLVGARLEDVLVDIDVSSPGGESHPLAILPSGPLPPNPSELLESDAMKATMMNLTQQFSTVIVDSPALNVVSDALTLAEIVDQIVAVGAIGKSKRDALRKFRRQLDLIGKQPVGVVATFTKFDRKKYDYYSRSSPGRFRRRRS